MLWVHISPGVKARSASCAPITFFLGWPGELAGLATPAWPSKWHMAGASTRRQDRGAERYATWFQPPFQPLLEPRGKSCVSPKRIGLPHIINFLAEEIPSVSRGHEGCDYSLGNTPALAAWLEQSTPFPGAPAVAKGG